MSFAGIDTIKATTSSYAGVEGRPFIQRQIRLALGRFEGVLAINAVEDLVETPGVDQCSEIIWSGQAFTIFACLLLPRTGVV